MDFFSDMDATGLEKWLSGQAGFILATVLFGVFFWKVLLPRWDRMNNAISRLADAVKVIAITTANHNKETGEKIIKSIEDLEGQ